MTLADARVFEIGYGARPYRLLALRAMGVDVRGVDAEVPVTRLSPSALATVYRQNGAERVAKSIARRALLDWRENQAFREALSARGLQLPTLDPDCLLIGDATSLELPTGSLDLIYSEDVFEHLEPEGLQALTVRMARWLRPGGLALIRPNIFTGITGGHRVEWNRRSLLFGRNGARRTAPWQHLMTQDFLTNTYLNRLTRADFRNAFSAHFEIVAEHVTHPDLGSEFLSAQLRERLADYADEELFSNQVRFVLRPLNGASSP